MYFKSYNSSECVCFPLKVEFVLFAEYIPELWYKSKNKIFNLQILLKLFSFFFQRTYFNACSRNCGTNVRTKLQTRKLSTKKNPNFWFGLSTMVYTLNNYTNRKPVDESSPLPKNLFVVFITLFIECFISFV